jgi:hypothetical protein
MEKAKSEINLVIETAGIFELPDVWADDAEDLEKVFPDGNATGPALFQTSSPADFKKASAARLEKVYKTIDELFGEHPVECAEMKQICHEILIAARVEAIVQAHKT